MVEQGLSVSFVYGVSHTAMTHHYDLLQHPFHLRHRSNGRTRAKLM